MAIEPGLEGAFEQSARAGDRLKELAPFLWHLRHVHRSTPRLGPMRFSDRPYAAHLAKMLPNLSAFVAQKAVQTSWTEIVLAYLLWAAGWQSRHAAMAQPTANAANRLVKKRVNLLLAEVSEYNERLPGGAFGPTTGTDDLSTKSFGRRGSISFLSAATAPDWVEFSCDIMVIDEWDEALLQKGGPENVARAEDRLEASDRPQYFRMGNPKIPGVGICELYEASTMARWHHKCPRCNHWQALDWFEHFVERTSGAWRARDSRRRGQEDIRPVCVKCGRPWDRTSSGAWVAEFPDRQLDGFHVWHADILSKRMGRYLRMWQEAQNDLSLIMRFYNSILGLGFSGAGMKITVEMLAEIATAPPIDEIGGDIYAGLPVFAGVDVGARMNVVIAVRDDEGNEPTRELVFMADPTSLAEVGVLFDLFHVDCFVCDADPETREVERFIWEQRSKGRHGWRARFHTQPKISREPFAFEMNPASVLLKASKTPLLDAVYSSIRSGSLTIPENHAAEVPEFSKQLRAPTRKLAGKNGSRMEWDRAGKADHYFLALAYERLAEMVWSRGGGWL